MCVYVYATLRQVSTKARKRLQIPLELELQAVGGCVGTKLTSCETQGRFCFISAAVWFLLFFYEFRACSFLPLQTLVILCRLSEIFVFFM